MKTTLVLSNGLIRKIKKLAKERRQSVSAIAEALLRRELKNERTRSRAEIRPLPTFDVGETLVDTSDRQALYAAIQK